MKTIAIYPGSFNPFTVGHQNIVEKAERIFGKSNVVIAIGINPDKEGLRIVSQSSQSDYEIFLDRKLEDKIKILKQQVPSKNVDGYVGFLTEYVREKEAEGYNVVVIRGLRNGHDFDYEYNQIRYMWDQMPTLNIMCLFADPLYMHVSSSAYRALESVQPGSGYSYLAKEVDTSEVTADMVETSTSAVVESSEEVDILRKYEIVPLDSVEHCSFKGTYKECLKWIKEQEIERDDKDEDNGEERQ